MALSALDLQQARIKLVVFKSRLRSTLYGVREPDPALFSPDENPFGQWLNGTAVPRLGRTADVRALQRLVTQMLGHGEELVALYRREQIERARTGLEQLDHYAEQIEALLQQLE